MARYYGGKNHLYQRFINLIPKHERFVSLFGGSAAVERHIRPAAESIVCELDEEQWARLRVDLPGVRVLCVDSLRILRDGVRGAFHATMPIAPPWGPETFVYADPPYPIEDRRDPRARYRCELTSEQHDELVGLLRATRARVLVCGQPWGRYALAFQDWRRHEFPVTLRSGKPGVECVWTNYDDPHPLHDYRYFGDDKRTRQDLRRVVSRNVARFDAMNRDHRVAVLRALAERFGAP